MITPLPFYYFLNLSEMDIQSNTCELGDPPPYEIVTPPPYNLLIQSNQNRYEWCWWIPGCVIISMFLIWFIRFALLIRDEK